MTILGAIDNLTKVCKTGRLWARKAKEGCEEIDDSRSWNAKLHGDTRNQPRFQKSSIAYLNKKMLLCVLCEKIIISLRLGQ